MNGRGTTIRRIVNETWKVILGIELEPRARPVVPADIEECIAASSQITGDARLAMVVYCSMAHARRVASIMFGVEEGAVTIDDIHDALRELVNIVSGNFKGLLDGTNQLSLPSLVKGRDFRIVFPRHVVLYEESFVCHGEPLIVSLLGGEDCPSVRRIAESQTSARRANA